MSDDIRIEHFEARRLPRPPRADRGWVSPVRLRSLIWVAIVGGVWLALTIYGTPHLRVQYTWNGRDSYPIYYKCWYWGFQSFETLAYGGHCPLVIFVRSKSGAR